jgi:hypothetical protein
MEAIAGYRTLHLQEAKYTGIALANMPAEIAVWHRYLTLFNRTMRKEHVSPSENRDDVRTAWGLQLSLASAASSSAKLILDATLAGYYSQAFALIRHMLETWQQMAYVRLNERAARQWFSPDGIRNPKQSNQNTVTKGSGNSASTTQWCCITSGRWRKKSAISTRALTHRFLQ